MTILVALTEPSHRSQPLRVGRIGQTLIANVVVFNLPDVAACLAVTRSRTGLPPRGVRQGLASPSPPALILHPSRKDRDGKSSKTKPRQQNLLKSGVAG